MGTEGWRVVCCSGREAGLPSRVADCLPLARTVFPPFPNDAETVNRLQQIKYQVPTPNEFYPPPEMPELEPIVLPAPAPSPILPTPKPSPAAPPPSPAILPPSPTAAVAKGGWVALSCLLRLEMT